MRLNFATSHHVRQAIRSARREVIFTLPSEAAVHDLRASDIAAARQSARSGITVRAYVCATAHDGAKADETLTRLARQGVLMHRVHRPMPKMWIIDRSVVVFDRGAEPQQADALIGHDLPFTELLLEGLEAERSGRSAETPPVPEPLTREVLRQLARGATDESAAREMGMAVRTYRRTVARLMDQLDARSRFQAGYRAAINDWL